SSQVRQCPTVMTIPSRAVRCVTKREVGRARYPFGRADSGEAVNTFPARQIADTGKIDLSSAGTLKLDDGKINIPLDTARELRVEYRPERADSVDPYADHFNHYFAYVERPAALDFDVVPRKLGASSAPTPKVGHHFILVDNY